MLGANDGIVSTASRVVGVATASARHDNILITGVAGLVAGDMSMAAGEYVLVHSQADTEMGGLSRERTELETDPAAERRELMAIYVARGLAPDLVRQVAEQLMTYDTLAPTRVPNSVFRRPSVRSRSRPRWRRPPVWQSVRRGPWL